MLVFIITITALLTVGCGKTLSPEPPGAAGPYLELTGAGIAREARITLDELKDMDEGLVEELYFSVNSYGTQGHTLFKGVRVWQILQKVDVLENNASTVSFIAEDGYQVQYTLAEVQRDDYIDETNPSARLPMILAWEEEGEEFDPQRGNPFQLVVGQKEPGDVNKPYWVRNIKTITVN
jgi:DMSO/TMAO reductase YedYZ molybdopterin-dependent catalytic subunit